MLPIVYYDNLARYVRDGGAVLVAAGPDYAATAASTARRSGRCCPPCRPARSSRSLTAPTISPVGLRHPVTRDLPGSESDPPAWSQWFRLVDADAIAGDITMTGPGDRPLLVLAREGEGRVAMLLSDHAWLWARGYEGGGPHAALLRRLLHWLMQRAGARGGGADGALGGPQPRRRAADAFRGDAAGSPSPARPARRSR